MAASMLATYPEVFAAGAVIAGLAHGCAKTVPEAFGRMRFPSEMQLQRNLRDASDYRRAVAETFDLAGYQRPDGAADLGTAGPSMLDVGTTSGSFREAVKDRGTAEMGRWPNVGFLSISATTGPSVVGPKAAAICSCKMTCSGDGVGHG